MEDAHGEDGERVESLNRRGLRLPQFSGRQHFVRRHRPAGVKGHLYLCSCLLSPRSRPPIGNQPVADARFIDDVLRHALCVT